MKRALFFYLSIIISLSLTSCMNSEAEASAIDENEVEITNQANIKEYIRAMEDTLAMAYNKRDVSLFEKFYGPGAITYGEGREQLFGKKNIVNHFKKNVAGDTNLTGTFSYQTIDVFAAENLAVETGRWEEMDNEGTEVDHGFYMVIFEKQDGRYVSIRDIWNSSTQQQVYVTPEEMEKAVMEKMKKK